MKKIKKYYIGCASRTDGCRDIDYLCGPYDTVNEAQIFKDRIAKEIGLNIYDYEWTCNINIYRSTAIFCIEDIPIYTEDDFMNKYGSTGYV